ncbi:L,D-transpeptidase family protein [Sphingobacteriaceae bacterium WQ 2009]|uniref:L,D-transpeptidase family protein n=1 Tax=Rhinopithecimicrobium faecis TaxID=2820698 RepID=A0A8T4HCV7_9SPHI|nr:L,D-transpeptidase family protein [Sphingobacteriaceae bacterium WQ 2009]
MNKIILPLLSLLLILQSCGPTKEVHFVHTLAPILKQPVLADFDTTAYFQAFDETFNKLKSSLKNPKWMAQFYADHHRKLQLTESQLLMGGMDTLCYFLSQAESHGMRGTYFHQVELQQALKELRTKKYTDVAEAYKTLATLEIRANDAFVAYINMLQYGAINPKNLYGRYFEKVIRGDFKRSEAAALRTDWAFFLDSIQPEIKAYKSFQEALAGPLSTAKREQIYLSMERLRWKGVDFPQEYIMVNIPEQQLRIVKEQEVQLMMRVCIGETDYAPFSKKGVNHETPILSGLIDRMQVNPVWNIPQSIVKKELLDKLIENPSYLENRNMVAYNKKGQLVDPQTVDWSADSVKSYSFKQNPGADNSLGNIKFIFKNPYAIYLHDTPSKAAFGAANRAVSHGCVRVEKPVDLAAYLVKDTVEAQKIKEEMLSDNTTSRWVKMKKGIPVFMTYYTTWFDPKGKITQYPDIYGYDAPLKEKMKKYFPKIAS